MMPKKWKHLSNWKHFGKEGNEMKKRKLALALSAILLLSAVSMPASASGKDGSDSSLISEAGVTPGLSITPTPTGKSSGKNSDKIKNKEDGKNGEDGEERSETEPEESEETDTRKNNPETEETVEKEAEAGSTESGTMAAETTEETTTEEMTTEETTAEETTAEESTTEDEEEPEEPESAHRITCNPLSIVFEEQREGYTQTQTETVTVTNTGTLPWDFSRAFYPSDRISVEGIPAGSLSPGESAVLSITTKPGLVPAHDEAQGDDDNFGGYIYLGEDDYGYPCQIRFYFTVYSDYQRETGELLSIPQLPPVTGTANGTGKKPSLLGLAEWVEIETTLGKCTAFLDWDMESCEYDPENRAEQTFFAKGTVQLPDHILNTSGISTEITQSVTVNAYNEEEQTEYRITCDVSAVDFNDYYENCVDPVEGPMINVYNKGTKPLALTVLMPSAFRYGTHEGADMKNLLPGESVLLELREDWTQLESVNTGNMRILTQVPGVELNIPLTYVLEEKEEKIEVSRGYLDFGAVNVDGTLSQTQSITVTNTGEKTVTVQAKDNEALFCINPASGSVLKPGASAEFTVQPKAAKKTGSFRSRLIFSTGSVEKVVIAAVEFRSETTVLTGIENPQPVIVENGCQKLPGALGLPNFAVLYTEEENAQGMINWNLENCPYDPGNKAEQRFIVNGTVMLPFDVVNPDEISLAVTADVTVKAADGQGSGDYALSLSKDVVYISGTADQKSEYVTLTNTGRKTIRLDDIRTSSALRADADKVQLKPQESTTLRITLFKFSSNFKEEIIELKNYDGTLLKTISVINRQIPKTTAFRFTPSYVDFGTIDPVLEVGHLSEVSFENHSGQDITFSASEYEYFIVELGQDLVTVKDGESITFQVWPKYDDKGERFPDGTYHETLSFPSSYYEPLLLDATMSINYSKADITPTPVPTKTPGKTPTKAPVKPSPTIAPTTAPKKNVDITPAAAQQKAQRAEQKEAVKTGDESQTAGMMVLLAVSAMAMLAVLRWKKLGEKWETLR